MALIFMSSDLVGDPYVDNTLPNIFTGMGHRYRAVDPLERIVEACEFSAAANGGADLVVLVHSTPTTATTCGTDDPVRVLEELRKLPETLVFRNAVNAKSVPALVIARPSDLLPGRAAVLASMNWVETI